jgi:predicted Holliday junction resolvase-like endonuclease
VTIGQITEHVVPHLSEFNYNPNDVRFIGSPVNLSCSATRTATLWSKSSSAK